MNRDGTGPEGKGPLTGRRLGDCSRSEIERPRGSNFVRRSNSGRGNRRNIRFN